MKGLDGDGQCLRPGVTFEQFDQETTALADLVAELERDGRPGLPRYLWRPYYLPKANYRGLHNTDPFIFGPRFLYSNCRQPRHSSLRRLARVSVIAFGSGKTIGGERRWVLDTVLVVKDFVDYEPARARDELENWVPAEYLDVTAGPLADSMNGNCGGCTAPTGPRFRLYRGATPADPVDGMFSFFPALPAGADIGFPRPPINLPPRYFNPRSWQAPKGLRHERSVDELHGLWSSLVQQVRESGLVLGTGARGPMRIVERTRRPAWALPDGYAFDRNAANER